MTELKKVGSGKILMGRLDHGCDLVEALTQICLAENITLGRIEAIGAVQSARIGYYNQKSREYRFDKLDRPMEIAQLTGNVSVKERKPFVHAHITLVDEKGEVYGGHLAPGTIVFACEVVIEAFDGPIFERVYDPETGLPLWA